MNILSIDAWGNEEDGYEWNAWYKVGEISKDEFDNTDSFCQWFIDNNYLNPGKDLYYADDDGCNIVIYLKANHEPLFAIEYGWEY